MQAYSGMIKARVAPMIVEKARARAIAEGVTVSEWVRTTLRHELREDA